MRKQKRLEDSATRFDMAYEKLRQKRQRKLDSLPVVASHNGDDRAAVGAERERRHETSDRRQ